MSQTAPSESGPQESLNSQQSIPNTIEIKAPVYKSGTEKLNENFAPQNVIWGTNIVIDSCQTRFRKFIQNFTIYEDETNELEPSEDGNNEPLYSKYLNEIHLIGDPVIDLNCMHLKNFDRDLHQQLITYPKEVLPIFDMIINEMYSARFPEDVLSKPIQIRPYNPGEASERSLRLLDPVDLDKIVLVPGMVTRISTIIPEMKRAFYECEKCHHYEIIDTNGSGGRFEEPRVCSQCHSLNLFKLIHNLSFFSDKQIIKLQEDPNNIPFGETPHTIILIARDDLVDSVNPGDRIEATGIFKASAVKVSSKMNSVRSVYRTYVDVLHFKKVRLHQSSGDKIKENDYEVELSDSDIEKIKKISQMPDVYDKLSNAMAPSVFENLDIKKGLLLQLLAGTEKMSNNDKENAGQSKCRSEINILLCGDPGTSKSQLLKYIYNLVPRSQYTNGKGSSSVGLTAYVTKDPETKSLVLQSGALVLADNGICCIDEFDKMNHHVRSILHEVMEQQTMSIAKAGIICTLNARVAILAAANPIDSHWNPKKTIIDNLQLPPTLLSRFDLIFLVLDPQNENYDRNLAQHIVSLFSKSSVYDGIDKRPHSSQEITNSDLRMYLAYAKQNLRPKIGESVANRLIEAYVEMRQLSKSVGQITAFPRQLESLIRLCEARAKCRLSENVSMEDVEEAIRLHKEALRQSATDPATGKIDVSILTTGVSALSRQQHVELSQAIRSLIDSLGTSRISAMELYERISQTSDATIRRNDFESALQLLENEGYIKTGPSRQIRVILHSI